jgi:hexokinase
MTSIQAKTQQFILDQGLGYAHIIAGEFFLAFQNEMRKGLKGEASCLAMLPTYVNVDRHIPPHRPVLVIDAGGTNLRVCKVSFDALGKETIEDFRQYPMPGTHGLLNRDVFFSLFGEYVSPIFDKNPEIDSIGFCFSYPTEILPNRDGVLLRWSKEVQAPEVVGQAIGRGVLDHVKDGHNKRVVILNDTVAALLAGKAQGEIHQCSQYAGFILGTGTNLAIVQPNSSISKINPAIGDGQQAINIESGNFNGFHIGKADQDFDASTKNPGQYGFEKMVSGAYLGPLFLSILKTSATEKMIGTAARDRFLNLKTLSSLELNQLLSNPFQAEVFKGILQEDLEFCVRIGSHLVQRASWLCALKIAAGVLFMGGGKNILHPISINIDGSTVHKMYGFYTSMASHLEKLLQPEGVHFMLVHKDNAPVLGAAIAALTN